MKIICGQYLFITFFSDYNYKSYLQIMAGLHAKQEFLRGIKYLYLHVKKDLARI